MSNKFSDFDFGFNLFNYDSFLPNSHHITAKHCCFGLHNGYR